MSLRLSGNNVILREVCVESPHCPYSLNDGDRGGGLGRRPGGRADDRVRGVGCGFGQFQRGQGQGVHSSAERVGEVNLSALAKAQHRTRVATLPQGGAISRSAASRARFHAVDNALISRRPKGTAARLPNPAATGLTGKNVHGELGFSALNGVAQAQQTKGGLDLEPPDQGLCAGGGLRDGAHQQRPGDL